MSKKNERIIKEIKKEDITERFPIKKKLDLKKEIDSCLTLLRDNNSISELSFIVARQKDKLFLEKDVKKLQEILENLAQVQIILEKIESKI